MKLKIKSYAITTNRRFLCVWTALEVNYCDFLFCLWFTLFFEKSNQLFFRESVFEHSWLCCFDEWVFDSRRFFRLNSLDFHDWVSGCIRLSLASGVRSWMRMACLCYYACLYVVIFTVFVLLASFAFHIGFVLNPWLLIIDVTLLLKN